MKAICNRNHAQFLINFYLPCQHCTPVYRHFSVTVFKISLLLSELQLSFKFSHNKMTIQTGVEPWQGR